MSSDQTLRELSQANLAHLQTFDASLEATQQESLLMDEVLQGAKAEECQEDLQKELEENSSVGIQIKTLKLVKKEEVRSEKVKEVQESVLVRKEDADALADGFSKKQGNREYHLNPRDLSDLAQDLGIGLHEELNAEGIIAFITNRMMTVDGRAPDPAIVNKAFEFLLEVMQAQVAQESDGIVKERLKKILKNLEAAKLKFYDIHQKEIETAEKIIGAVDAVVTETGEAIGAKLEHYRDIVHNPPDLQTLRKFYQEKGYEAMMKEFKGLSNYLGSHLKRTDLEGPELAQLRGAVIKMQSIIGVFAQAKLKLNTLQSYLNLNHLFY